MLWISKERVVVWFYFIFMMIIVIINYTTTEKVLFKYKVKTLAYKKNPGYAIGIIHYVRCNSLKILISYK